MLRKKCITLIYILFILCLNINAYSANLRVSVNKREVNINKTLILTIEIDKNVKDFELPKISDFLVISQKTYEKNDKIIYKLELAPKMEGFFDIPAIVVGEQSSKPIGIKVYENKKNQNTFLNRDNYSFVDAYTDTKIVYVSQLFSYNLHFRTKKDLAENPSYTLPMFQNFWKNKTDSKSGYKLFNGENYFTFDISTSLYPMKEGEIVIDPASVSVKYINSNNVSKFETKKIKVKVLPLPNLNKPDNFSGAVGKYEISAVIDKSFVKVNEPIVLSIKIKGNGNINSVIEPNIKLPDELKKYATTVTINKEGFINSKKFQCVIIPMLEGNYSIPKISFSYFNTDLKEYVVVNTKEFNINVSGKKQDEQDIDNIQNIVDDSNSNKQLQQIDDEIVIKKDVDLSINDGYLINNKLYMVFIVLVILLVIMSIIYRIRLFYIYKDVVKVQKMNAKKEFIICMQKAKLSLNRNEQYKFFSYIDIGLKMLLKSKNNYEYCAMLKEEINENLKKLNFEDKQINEIMSLLNDCEKFKFTNIIVKQNKMSEIYTKVEFIKNQMDKMIL